MSVSVPAAVGSVEMYGGLANVRKLHEQNKKEFAKKEAALMEEIERTGMIENGKGEMVSLSSLNDIEKRNLIERAKGRLCTRDEMIIGFLATAPHSDEVEAEKARAAHATKLQSKMLAGKQLTGEERKWLRENDPGLSAMADRMEAEAKALEQKLKNCKDPKDAQRVYMDAKTQVMSQSGENDGTILFLIPALDEVYSKHMKHSASNITMEFFV